MALIAPTGSRAIRQSLLAVAFATCIATAHAAAETSALALIERGSVEMRTDPEAGRINAEAALVLLARAPDPDAEIRARLLLCDYLSERDQAAAGREIEAIDRLLPQARRAGLRAGALVCEGDIHETRGENASARRLYEQAVDAASQASDDEMLAGALFARGHILCLQGEYAAGLNDLRQAQALYEQLDLPHHALTALNGIATLYNRMGAYGEARDMYQRAAAAQRAAGMSRELAVTLHNLGRANENLREWRSARDAFAESLATHRKLGYLRGEAYALRGLATVATATGDAPAALTLLDQAAELQSRTPDERLRAQIALARGVALRDMGRLADSASSLEDAIQVFRSGEALHDLATTTTALAAVQSALGNFREAYEFELEAKATSERLLRNQIDQRFASLKIEFDTAAKDKENALLLRENDASTKAIAEERRARALQTAVIVLTAALAVVLATLAFYHRRNSQRMRQLAMTDELTGAPNRRAVLRSLEQTLERGDGSPVSILITDIDFFKSVNDELGHPVGDQVLKQLAATLRNGVREPALFGRLGGEEFLIVLTRTPLEQAMQVAERLREDVSRVPTGEWFPNGRHLTTSIGVTTAVPDDTLSTLLRRADTALYAAKRAGRNRVRAEPMPPVVVSVARESRAKPADR